MNPEQTPSEMLGWLVDRERVGAVLVRVALSQDAHEWTALGDCFEPDAVYVHPTGQIDGAEGIVDRSRAALGELDASQHLVGSIDVRIDGDVAHTISYFQAQHVRADAPGGQLYTVGGTYADTLVRRGDTWRISRRVQTYTFRDGNRKVVHP